MIQAAYRVVELRGATSLTIDAVAAESGLSKGGVLYHFPNKHEPKEAPHIPYAIDNQRIVHTESKTHVPYGPWRSVDHWLILVKYHHKCLKASVNMSSWGTPSAVNISPKPMKALTKKQRQP